jgi:hypothetical protein
MAGLRAFPVQIVYRADSLPELEDKAPGAVLARGCRAKVAAGYADAAATAPVFKHLRIMDMSDQIALALIRIVLFGAIVVLGFCVTPGLLATISRTADLQAALTAAWSMMGSANAWKNWLAPFGCMNAGRPLK